MSESPASFPPSSLIICSRNRPDLLWGTVCSLFSGKHLPAELIIVDQSEKPHPQLSQMSSRDGCVIHYIHSHSKGASRSRNEGLRAAVYDILVCIDDDMQLSENCYQALITAQVQAGPHAVVTGRVLPGEVKLPGGFVPTVVERTEPGVFQGRIGTDVLPSCLMSMSRFVYQTVGGFDERLGPGCRFNSAEDNDFGFRVLEAGFKIVYDPQIVIYHLAWRGNKNYFKLRWGYGRGKGGFFTKYWSLRDPYMIKRFLKDLQWRLVRFPGHLVYYPRRAIGDFYYTAGALSGCLEWLIAYGLNDQKWKISKTVKAQDISELD